MEQSVKVAPAATEATEKGSKSSEEETKSKKPVPLSLEEFHALGQVKRTAEENGGVALVLASVVTQDEDDFFARLERDAKNVLNREARLDELRRSCNAGVRNGDRI
jgi:hypothetical protein